MTLEWTYHKIHTERNVRLSMPGYVKEALVKFNHDSIKQQFAASPYKEPIYGRKVQYADIIEISTFKKVNLL